MHNMKLIYVPYIESNTPTDIAKIHDQHDIKDYLTAVKWSSMAEVLGRRIPIQVLQNLSLKTQKGNVELVVKCIQLWYIEMDSFNWLDARKLFLDIGNVVKETTRIRFIVELHASMLARWWRGFINFPPISIENNTYCGTLYKSNKFQKWLEG